MLRRVVLVVAAWALAFAFAPGAGQAAPAAAPAAVGEAGAAAAAFANALVLGNGPRAWQLLSAKSQQDTDAKRWAAAYEQQAPPAKPRADILLRALASASEPPVIGDEIVRAEEAFVEVKGNAPVTYRIVVVKDPAGWRVDLAATDALNARAAAEQFLQVMREETLASAGKGARTSAPANAVVTSLLSSLAKDYRAVETIPDGPERATVVVQADLPVTLILRAARSGPGWNVDVYRPLATADLFSPNALQEAAAASERQACEAQLRELAKALEIYCAQSDDMLPDPARWFDQLAPLLPAGTTLHCPADTVAGVSYAMNANLAGKRRREIADPSSVPVFFESTKHGRNPADTGQSWPVPARHSAGNEVLWLDKAIRPSPTLPSFEVKVAPPGSQAPARATPGPRPSRRPGTGPDRPPVRPMPQ